MRTFRYVLAGAALIVFAACKDTLLVDNPNQADRNRALGTFADLESFLGAGYASAHSAVLGGQNDDLQTQLLVMGFENVSGLANFAMGPRGAVPRVQIDNQPNGTGDAGNLWDFTAGHRAARVASLALAKLKTVSSGSPAQDGRDRAFCYFVRGVALGNLSLTYDSASILSENDDPQAIIHLSSYQAVNTAALRDLDSAIAITNASTTGFPLPATWINGNALNATQFVQFIRSYKARLRADVARSPAERAAVDWTQVIADATNGITSDFIVQMNPATGWDVIWPAQAFATGSASWHQMSQFMLGFADTSGAFDAWLALPRGSRAPFVVATPDLRLPQGTTRTAQIGDTSRAGFKNFYVSGTTNPGRPYVRNRPTGEDAPQDPFGFSMYDFNRTRTFALQSPARTGPYPIMTAAEIRLLAAEGYLRQGSFASAIPLINMTRTDPLRAGLPAVSALIADTNTAIGTLPNCVPRVPDIAKAFKGTKCGNVWDALKWEYHIETMYTGYGMWYFAARGWGDLPEGSAMSWPVPNEEMLTRNQPFYGLGGVGGPASTGKGNYGLFSGGVY
jgi:hypothetical protein